MASGFKESINLGGIKAGLGSQFKGLDKNDPSGWPILPKSLLLLVIAASVTVALWFLVLSSSAEELEAAQAKEVALKQDYTKKLTQAINLEALRKQREQVLQYVTQIEKQLPSKAEMDALLSDVNQAGLGRSLSFDVFRPGAVAAKEYYAELPIALRVTGRFHDLGAFTADIANLSRIVTINNVILSQGRDGALAMDATVKTFRYLDQDEVASQRKAASAPAGGKRK